MDSFKMAAPEVPVQLDSVPPGADAKTSLGPGCKTPCTVSVPAPDAGFSVTFTMDKYQPATIPVQVIRNSGDFNTSPPVVMDPSPVVAELQPMPGAPPKAVKRMRPKKPKPQKSAAAPAATGSAFPAPAPGRQ